MLHPKMAHVYVGMDVHRSTHTATIIDCFFEKLGSITITNTESGFKKLVSEVKKHQKNGITAIIGLEDIHSTGRELAVFLINHGFAVKYVNPALTNSERKNQATFHKTDDFDSLCIARVLLTKLNELPEAKPDDLYWVLSELVAKRSAVLKANTALKNQLRTYIMHHYPRYTSFFTIFSSNTSITFWEKYPSPAKLKETTVEELGEFLRLKTYGVHSIDKARQIFKTVEEDNFQPNEYQEIRDTIVTTTAKQIKDNLDTIDKLDKQIESILPKFGYKLQTMKGISTTFAAGLIAHIGNIDRFSNASKLAKFAGISPVSYATGKTSKHFSDRRGDKELRHIFFHIAVLVVSNYAGQRKPHNQYFYEYYNRKISEGKTKRQALKCVMRRLVNIIYRMMKDKSEYYEKPMPNTQE
jgi:transposase